MAEAPDDEYSDCKEEIEQARVFRKLSEETDLRLDQLKKEVDELIVTQFQNEAIETEAWDQIFQLVVEAQDSESIQALEESDEERKYLRQVKRQAKGKLEKLRRPKVSERVALWEQESLSRSSSTSSLSTEATGAIAKKATRAAVNKGEASPIVTTPWSPPRRRPKSTMSPTEPPGSTGSVTPPSHNTEMQTLESFMLQEVLDEESAAGRKVSKFQNDAGTLVFLLTASAESLQRMDIEVKQVIDDEEYEQLNGQVSVMNEIKRDLEDVRSGYVKLKAASYPFTAMKSLKKVLDEVRSNHSKLEYEINRHIPEVKVEALAPAAIVGPNVSGQGKLPNLQLPRFATGSAAYKKFKEQFHHLLGTRQVVEGSKAEYLMQALHGEAAEKCKGVVSRLSTINEIWEHLDCIYECEATIAEEAVCNIFKEPAPKATIEDVDRHWYRTAGHIKSIKELGFTGENLIINYTIQTLPLVYQEILENELTKMYPGQVKFTWKEAQKAYAASIGKKKSKAKNGQPIVNTLQQSQSFLPSVKSQEAPPNTGGSGGGKNKKKEQNAPQPQTQMLYSAPAQQPQYNQQQTYYGARGRGGRGRGRGLGYHRPFQPAFCQLCPSGNNTHEIWYCTVYKTAEQKRERLRAINRCQACNTPMHRGTNHTCKEVFCKWHNQCGHLSWTCDGNNHPGPQPNS